MRLTYSHVYPDDKKYNLTSGNASNNLKKKSYNFFWDYSFILIRIISKCFETILSYDYWDQKKTTETSVTFDINSLKINKNTTSGNFWTW